MLTDIKETLVNEHLRTTFCCIEQSSFNLINSKKDSPLLLIDADLINIFNTRIYNLIFVPQITRFLLADNNLD